MIYALWELNFNNLKKRFIHITEIGIRPEMPEDIKEQVKLVNGISFLGIPISVLFIVLFGLTGHVYIALTFLGGLAVFSLPFLLMKTMGLNVARNFVCAMAPVVFGTASVVSGKDTGFFLGFLVISVPPIIVYPKSKQALAYIILCVLLLALSIVGNVFIEPIDTVPFAMGVFLFNLFIVLTTSIGIVFLFKLELNEGREKLAEKNKEITDSINYAKRIQSAYMPLPEVFHRAFSHAFLFFKPKDIVSGDFYWFYAVQKENTKKYIRFCAVADCTGHGVPGALMSVICCNALNEVVVNNKVYDTAKILDETRRIVKQNLKSAGTGQKDGMDISLIKMDDDTDDLWFSGANNPAWIVSGNELVELKADKQPIGAHPNEKEFTAQHVMLKKGDIIYLFSDGYADQFGGPKGKKFKYKQLSELLQNNNSKTMEEQHEILEETLHHWKGAQEQTDDVCVIGIKI